MLVHKAVELPKVKVARRKVLSQEGWLAANYIMQPKHDGCNAIMILGPDGGAGTLSRTGEIISSMGVAEREAAKFLKEEVQLHGGLVLLGEAWWPGKDQFSEISGHFRRHAESDKLRFVVFDCLTLTEWAAGKSDLPYINRINRLPTPRAWGPNPYPIQLVRSYMTRKEPQDACNDLVEKGGYDGAIYRDPMGKWERGSGTTGEIIKVKSKVSVALRVTGTYEGVGKNAGRVGALGLSYKGKELRCNAGTDAEREAWWVAPDLIVGKIVEVEALGESSEGLLREPRYKGIRDDVLEPDA